MNLRDKAEVESNGRSDLLVTGGIKEGKDSIWATGRL